MVLDEEGTCWILFQILCLPLAPGVKEHGSNNTEALPLDTDKFRVNALEWLKIYAPFLIHAQKK